MKKIRLVLILIIIWTLSACKDNIVTDCNSNPTINSNLTTFKEIQTEIFDQSCALSGCHAGSQPQAGLFLTEGYSYELLVNVTSLLNPNFRRIEPGSSQNSFLIKMLRNTGEGTSQMPPSRKLSNETIDSIAAWIDRGAVNN